ncbi:MAG: polysaccharide deacetylase, partial [Clostridia bacterium]|nr:polysaccharide deacetylase [Clostridia bacterium]
WGHAYEFARDNNWEVIENFCKAVSGKEDIWHATNMEIYEYVQNFNRLIFSLDQRIVQNPTAQTLWFQMSKQLYAVKPGETLTIGE